MPMVALVTSMTLLRPWLLWLQAWHCCPWLLWLQAWHCYAHGCFGYKALLHPWWIRLLHDNDAGGCFGYKQDTVTPMVDTVIAWQWRPWLLCLQACKWHQGAEPYGKVWKKGDVIGCMLDFVDKTVSECHPFEWHSALTDVTYIWNAWFSQDIHYSELPI